MRVPALITRLFFVLIIFVLLRTTYVLAEDLLITAVVPAQVSDFYVELQSDLNQSDVEAQEEIPFTIVYDSSLEYPTQLTIEATWPDGTVQGSGTPIEVVEYFLGSASNAYNNTAPVVDLNNNKITWTINAYPDGVASQSVSFILRTKTITSTTNLIDFSVNAIVKGPGVITPAGTKSFTYTPPPVQITPTPTATPTPTDSPTSNNTSTGSPTTPQATATPTPGPTLAFTNIYFSEISSDSTSLFIQTNKSSRLQVILRDSNGNRLQTIPASTARTIHQITVENLSPETQYLLEFIGTSGQESITSELISFTTAIESTPPEITINSLIIVSNNTVLTTPTTAALNNVIVMPSSTNYSFRVHIENTANLKTISGLLRSHNFLGITEGLTFPTSETVEMIEIQPNTFEGILRTPTKTGSYDLIVRITDTQGNITEEAIRIIRISQPLTILSPENQPIENAKIRISFYNPRTKKFEFLSPERFTIQNPSSSNAYGIAELVLPQGRYKADIQSFGFEKKTVMFSIGEDPADGYPTVILTPIVITPLYFLSYIGDSIEDLVLNRSFDYLTDLTESKRFLYLLQFTLLVILSILSLLSLYLRLHLSLRHLPSLIKHLFHKKKMGQHEPVLRGIVTDSENDKVLQNVMIYIMREGTEEILGQTTTNRQGQFSISHLPKGHLKLMVMGRGYQSFHLHRIEQSNELLSISLAAHPRRTAFITRILHAWLHVLAISFEGLLGVLLVLILLISLQVGWIILLPFVLVAVLNMALWIGLRR
jgi:hypothetical protein